MFGSARLFPPKPQASDGGSHRQATCFRHEHVRKLTADHIGFNGCISRIGPVTGSCYKGAASHGREGSKEALMGFPVRLCALIGRFSDPRVAESVDALVPHLLSQDVQVLICEEEDSFTDRSPGIVRMLAYRLAAARAAPA